LDLDLLLFLLRLGSEAIAAAAVASGCRSVAFTYNDPVIFLEYAVDVAQACRERGIKTVAVSAGYICAEPRREFFRHMDGANIDLKGFTAGFYKNLCTGRLHHPGGRSRTGFGGSQAARDQRTDDLRVAQPVRRVPGERGAAPQATPHPNRVDR
jgi:hypothetical protein